MSNTQNNGALRRIINVATWPTAIVYIIFGLLLLIAPDVSNRIIGYTLAAICTIAGCYFIITYIRADSIIAFHHQDLTTGLIALAVGIFLLVKPDIPGELMGYIWGIALLIGGLAKVQIAADMFRLKTPRWWLSLIGAVVVLTLGVLSLSNVFEAGITLLRFNGAALLVEGLLDIFCWYQLRMLRKRIETMRSGNVGEKA